MNPFLHIAAVGAAAGAAAVSFLIATPLVQAAH